MTCNLKDLTAKDVYATMTHTIVPRPIAWVLTENAEGSHNLAPFSYFNGICSDPPLVSLSVGKRPDGRLKDTWQNLTERPAFVLHIPSSEHAEQVTASSTPLEPNDSEIEAQGLSLSAVEGWPLPRLTGPKVAYLCHLHQIVELGNKPQALIIAELKELWWDESLGERLPLDIASLDPLARLSHEYARISELPNF